MKTRVSVCLRKILPLNFSDWYRLGAILFMSITLPSAAFAQNVLWDKTLGGDKDDELTTSQLTADGGYILGGTSASGKNGDKTEDSKGSTDFWVVKLNSNGSKAWDKTFGGTGEDNLTSLQQTKDGGYILAGYSNSPAGKDKTANSRGGLDYWIVKLNKDGSKAWDKTYGGNRNDQISSVQPTNDGGYLLGGTSKSDKSGEKSEANKSTYPLTQNDFWVIKTDAKGTIIWEKTIGGNKEDNLATVQLTKDGGYVLGGYSSSQISGDKSEANKGGGDYWIVKLNVNGIKTWDKTIGGNEFDNLSSLQQTNDQGYILAGTSSSGKSKDKTEPGRDNILNDYWVVKLNSDGSKAWDKTIGGNLQDILKSVQQTSDGGYLLGGSSASRISGEKSEDRRGEMSGTYDYWLVKLSSSGALLYEKTIGSPKLDELTALQQTRDGNFFLSGTSNSRKGGEKIENSKGRKDFWVVKLENNFRQFQTIDFEPIPLTKEVGDPAFALFAKATSGLPITYQILSGPAIIKGNMLTVTGAGTVRVEAIQTGNQQYNPAEATQSFEVTLTGKQWQMSYGGNQADTLTSMLATADGGYLLGGTSASNISGEKSQAGKGSTDYWVAKIDAAGRKVCDKKYGGSNADKLTTLVPTPYGRYLVGGYSASDKSGDKSQVGNGNHDYWLVKIDAAGNKLWDKSYGGSNADQLTSLLATPDGGYLLGGTSYSGESGEKSQPSRDTREESYYRGDYWVVKINSNGTKLWDKTYGGNYKDNLAAMILWPGGGYILGGSSSSGVSGEKTQAPRAYTDYWVIRIDEQGKKVWDNTYGGIIGIVNGDVWYEAGASRLSSLVATPDGNILVGGSSYAFKGAEKTENTISELDELSDYWLLKIDQNGKKLWDKVYGGLSSYPGEINFDFYTETGNSELSKMLPLPEGGYLLAGTSNADNGRNKSEDDRGNVSKNEGERDREEILSTSVWNDYWIVKINEQGQVVEDRTIGGHKNDMLAAVVRDTAGNFILGGTSFSGIGADKSTDSRGEADYWVVQVKENKLEEPVKSPSVWALRYGGYRNDNLMDVIKTTDGGYLSVGFSDSNYNDYEDDVTSWREGQDKNNYWIVKTDRNGKKLWDKMYGGGADDYLNRVIQTQDGGYLLGGSSLSGAGVDKSESSQGDRDYWVVKVDAQGNKQWDKRFGGSGSDELKKVIQLSSSEYVLGGYSNSPVSGDKSQASQGGNDFWLVKISNTGTKIWDKRYGGNAEETLGSFTATQDGGFLLGGSSLSGVSGDKSQPARGNTDYWLVRTDKQGNLLWDKTYGGNGPDEAYSIARNGSGFFIAGTSSSGANGDKTQGSRGGQDYWVVMIDENGNKLWDRTFGGNKDDELRASTRLNDGSLVLGGTSFSELSGDKTQTSRGMSDYWMVRIDAAGNKITDRRFGGSGTEELHTIFQTSDGGLLLAGRSDSNVSGEQSQLSLGRTDYWLVKIATETNALAANRQATSAEEVKAQVNEAQVKAYPNPFSERATIRFTLPETQQASVKVYDGQGNEITTLFNGEAKAKQVYEVEWNASNKPAGLYFLQLQTLTKKHQQKLLLTK